MFAKLYSPRSLVTVERLTFVCSLVRVTSTPGITPPASLIDPRRPPWKPCPNTDPAAATTSNAPNMSVARNLIGSSVFKDNPCDRKSRECGDSRGGCNGLQHKCRRLSTGMERPGLDAPFFCI